MSILWSHSSVTWWHLSKDLTCFSLAFLTEVPGKVPNFWVPCLLSFPWVLLILIHVLFPSSSLTLPQKALISPLPIFFCFFFVFCFWTRVWCRTVRELSPRACGGSAIWGCLGSPVGLCGLPCWTTHLGSQGDWMKDSWIFNSGHFVVSSSAF